MDDSSDSDERAIERLKAALIKHAREEREAREEQEVLARFRSRSDGLEGEARQREIATFIGELVSLKARRTPGAPVLETGAALIEELRTSPSKRHLIELLLDPPVDA